MSHPFGDLLRQFRARKAGLTQMRLAELAGYDRTVLGRMIQGRKDLTGPSGRERIVRIMAALCDEGALTTLDEAHSLLKAAGMPPLYEGAPDEAALMRRLKPASPSRRHASSLRPRHTNLPRPLTRFIGRQRQLADLTALIAKKRLLTLTGPGGVGKSRLAIEIGASFTGAQAADGHVDGRPLPLFADGVWLVELAPISDPARVAHTVAAALNLPEQPDHIRFDALSSFLSDKRLLLILDNCEHLIDACADMVERLLSACPELHVLATSREALNVAGETTWRVPSLTAPDPARPPALEQLLGFEAVELFVDHASAAQPNFSMQPGNVAAIARICHQLDGIPLAIEMAAAQLSVLSIAEIAAGLTGHFRLQMAGRRTALKRHQTLRATLDWSYALLNETERVLLRRLSVFAGGWTAEMTGEVCAITDDVLPLLSSLVRKSLVVITQVDGQTRYHYLETIRQYGWQKLAESGEQAALQRRHAQACAALAERSYAPSRGSEQRVWMARLEREYPNLRAALAWSFGPEGDALVGCRIFANLLTFWNAWSHAADALHWLRLARSALTPQMPLRLHGAIWLASALLDISQSSEEVLANSRQSLAYYTTAADKGGMANAIGSIGSELLIHDPLDQEGQRLMEECVALASAAGDLLVEHTARRVLADTAAYLRQYERAEALFLENIGLCRATGDLFNLAQSLSHLAHLHMEREQYRQGLALAREAAEAARQINDMQVELIAECIAAENVRYLGDATRAVMLNEACLAFARDKFPPLDRLVPTMTLSKALFDAGELDRAQGLLDDWLNTVYRSAGASPTLVCHATNSMACIASARGEWARAARLFGAAEMLFAASRDRMSQNHERDIAPYIDRARTALGAAAYETAHVEGCTLTVAQAIACALRR